jgi:Holliday junction resolvase
MERALIRALQDHGLAGERVPLSGSAGGSYTADLTVPLLGRDLRVEAKARGTGFNQLYRWLDSADMLIVRADRSEPLVVVPFRLAVEIAKAAENSRTRVNNPPAEPGN